MYLKAYKVMYCVIAASIGCLKFETIIQSQKREPVIHPLARTCIGGESESEGVIYSLCNSTHMSHWKRGTKVRQKLYTL